MSTTMSFRSTLLRPLAVAALAFGLAAPALAAEGAPKPPREEWSFAGPFGTFDQAQLQRGFQVFKEVCASCHAAHLFSFRNLAQPGGPSFSEAQAKAVAESYQVQDGPNDAGDMFDRPGRLSDRWPSPFPNEQAARASNGGAYPPDFSTLAKARTYEVGFPGFLIDIFTQYQEQGPDYIHALLVGYEETPPEGAEVPDGKFYNHVFPGHAIGMPPPLADGSVKYATGVEDDPATGEDESMRDATLEESSHDVSAFLMWVAEPHLNDQKAAGFRVLAFLILFAVLMWFVKQRLWRNVEH